MFKKIFIRLCSDRNESPSSVCKKIGISPAAFSQWDDNTIPRKITQLRVAEYFGVSVDYLLGKEDLAEERFADEKLSPHPSSNAQQHRRGIFDSTPRRSVRIPVYDELNSRMIVEVATVQDSPSTERAFRVPVYGYVAAGIPLEAITDIEDYEEISADMAKCGEYAALRIHGDSMEPRMTEGDVVIVRVQPTIESGETAIVIVNGAESTCKKIKKTPEGILLISTNPKYEPMFYSNKQIEELPVRIFGKVVELRAKF